MRPTLKDAIFHSSARAGYSDLSIGVDEIKRAVLSHKEFEEFRAHALGVFSAWRTTTTKFLKDTSTKDHPKAIIHRVADYLLQACSDLQLIDRYDIYQHLMAYWAETMQDDCYIITVDGWVAGNQVMRLQKENNGKRKDIAGLDGLEGRLVPVALLLRTYFGGEQQQIEELNTKLEYLAGQMDEFKGEHGGEEGLLAGVIDEKDKVSKAAVQWRIKDIRTILSSPMS